MIVANNNRVNKPCEDCGEIMENVSPLRRLCCACRKKRADVYNKKYREEHRAPKKEIEYVAPVFNPYAKYCKGCKYWGSNYGSGCCNYIFIEGHRRPCPPGKGCTEYKRGRRPRRYFELGV